MLNIFTSGLKLKNFAYLASIFISMTSNISLAVNKSSIKNLAQQSESIQSEISELIAKNDICLIHGEEVAKISNIIFNGTKIYIYHDQENRVISADYHSLKMTMLYHDCSFIIEGIGEIFIPSQPKLNEARRLYSLLSEFFETMRNKESLFSHFLFEHSQTKIPMLGRIKLHRVNHILNRSDQELLSSMKEISKSDRLKELLTEFEVKYYNLEKKGLDLLAEYKYQDRDDIDDFAKKITDFLLSNNCLIYDIDLEQLTKIVRSINQNNLTNDQVMTNLSELLSFDNEDGYFCSYLFKQSILLTESAINYGVSSETGNKDTFFNLLRMESNLLYLLSISEELDSVQRRYLMVHTQKRSKENQNLQSHEDFKVLSCLRVFYLIKLFQFRHSDALDIFKQITDEENSIDNQKKDLDFDIYGRYRQVGMLIKYYLQLEDQIDEVNKSFHNDQIHEAISKITTNSSMNHFIDFFKDISFEDTTLLNSLYKKKYDS